MWHLPLHRGCLAQPHVLGLRSQRWKVGAHRERMASSSSTRAAAFRPLPSAAIPVPQAQHHSGVSFASFVLCSAAEARVVMELFSEVCMGSLLSRTPVQIPRRHWPVALEIRAVAESPAAALSPCLRRAKSSRRPSFFGSADSSTAGILFPSSHPRIPSSSPSLSNLTRHIPTTGDCHTQPPQLARRHV